MSVDGNPDLEGRLRAVMERGPEASLPDEAFNDLALEVFRFQVRENPVYGAFVRGRGLDPEGMTDWREIPSVPIRAFRELAIYCGDPGGAEATFHTSGTTGAAAGAGSGGAPRGRHHVRSLSLYRASAIPNAAANLRPDGVPLRVLALLPPPGSRPDSSLVRMVGWLAEEWDGQGGAFFGDPEWRLARADLQRALEAAADGDLPVLLAGTAFAFVHWIDRVDEEGGAVALPPGSRIVETGGFKGRSREVSRAELYGALERTFGVPPERIVNEYGMTELLSQFYEPVLREGGPAEPDRRRLMPPPWVRTRVLDPRDLSPVPEGSPGILGHVDLANLYSAAAVVTEDLGVAVGDGFRVLGRTPGAEPRGCSLTMEELLR